MSASAIFSGAPPISDGSSATPTSSMRLYARASPRCSAKAQSIIPNPGIAWEIVERYGVTKMFTAPTALRMFMRYGESYPAAHDLTTLRVIACAGEPLNPEAWRWAQTHLAGDGKWGYVIDNWWQTELGGPALGTPPSMAMRPGKVGVAVPGAEADVLDENGKSAPPELGDASC